ncbi:MAG: DUF4926 domain-containing protein [Nostoc sp.]|uniref:DUF4926 domain-containing protein n=1 Tax=Nostoc sp. TaxID=1180 RepID=UPI002FFBA190
MILAPYSLVELVTDRYQDRGVSAGMIGTILEVYEDEAYEIEFSRDDGTTIAWFAVPQNEVKPLANENLVSIPSQKKSA